MSRREVRKLPIISPNMLARAMNMKERELHRVMLESGMAFHRADQSVKRRVLLTMEQAEKLAAIINN